MQECTFRTWNVRRRMDGCVSSLILPWIRQKATSDTAIVSQNDLPMNDFWELVHYVGRNDPAMGRSVINISRRKIDGSTTSNLTDTCTVLCPITE